MITHSVLLQPRAETTSEEIATALEHVREIQRAISGIVDVQTGKNMSNFNQGYTYGFIMHFVDTVQRTTNIP
jgi:hypothetical protein